MRKVLITAIFLAILLLAACEKPTETPAFTDTSPALSPSPSPVPSPSAAPVGVTLADFQGKWYSYSGGWWLTIEGDAFTMVSDEDGYESTGLCKLDGEILTLVFDDGDLDREVTMTPDRTLAGEWLGHFWPQEGQTSAGIGSPIDLSENSYIGEWHCAELDESIDLGWGYGVGHITRDELGEWHSSGTYEIYGNRFVLGYTSTSGGEETIFNGGDAIYDPDAQTLTTAGKYVYERVSYGGGLKLGGVWYDFYDWGSPYITKEEIVSEIIVVWQKNDEDVDPQYLDVDNLIQIVDEDDSEHESIFIIACEAAGVDYTTYFGF